MEVIVYAYIYLLSGANISAVLFLVQLVAVASSLCYSRKLKKKIIYIYRNKEKTILRQKNLYRQKH